MTSRCPREPPDRFNLTNWDGPDPMGFVVVATAGRVLLTPGTRLAAQRFRSTPFSLALGASSIVEVIGFNGGVSPVMTRFASK